MYLYKISIKLNNRLIYSLNYKKKLYNNFPLPNQVLTQSLKVSHKNYNKDKLVNVFKL